MSLVVEVVYKTLEEIRRARNRGVEISREDYTELVFRSALMAKEAERRASMPRVEFIAMTDSPFINALVNLAPVRFCNYLPYSNLKIM